MKRAILTLLTMLAGVLAGCGQAHAPMSQGQATVLWISVDGMRGDYVGRAHPKYLSELMTHAYYTTQMRPIFPSLTFPSHISEATGAPAEVHGITSNTFYDPATKQKHNMPEDPRLVEAEPVWLTAAREGVRTAVVDWPLSNHLELLPASVMKPVYSSAKYEASLTDAQRLGKVADVYAADFAAHPGEEPMRLLMGYVHAVDSAGHKYGPEAPEVDQAVRDTDEVLETVISRVEATFEAHARAEDSLYVVISTDHGMSTVKSTVDLKELLGKTLPKSAVTMTSGPLGNVYLVGIPNEYKDRVAKDVVEEAKKHAGVRAWTRESLPKEYEYAQSTRAGDVIVMLPVGQTFHSARVGGATPAGPKGMHGYPPGDDAEMLGFCLICPVHSGKPANHGVNLGKVDSLRLYPTVVALLGIKPSPQAGGRALNFP